MAKKPEVKEKRPAHRPSEYREEYCDMLVKHMSDGSSFETFAAIVGHGIRTMYDWADQFPAFSHAKNRGDALSRLWWENIGKSHISLTNSKESTTTFNSAVWIFTMKNRFKWVDKQPSEVPNIEIKADTEHLTEVKKEIKALIYGLKSRASGRG